MENTTQERKNKLADALEKEHATLPEKNGFGESNNKQNYGPAIEYLRTGNKPTNWKNNDLLYACVEDFETMCSDFDIE